MKHFIMTPQNTIKLRRVLVRHQKVEQELRLAAKIQNKGDWNISKNEGYTKMGDVLKRGVKAPLHCAVQQNIIFTTIK